MTLIFLIALLAGLSTDFSVQRQKILLYLICKITLPFSQKGAYMNQLEIIQQLEQENAELKAQNQKLTETVAWMHDTIWSLIKRKNSRNAI